MGSQGWENGRHVRKWRYCRRGLLDRSLPNVTLNFVRAMFCVHRSFLFANGVLSAFSPQSPKVILAVS